MANFHLALVLLLIFIAFVLLWRLRRSSKEISKEDGESSSKPKRKRFYKYEAFRNLAVPKKLEVIDKARETGDGSAFFFLKEAVRKEQDFTVKVALKRALKEFDEKDYTTAALITDDEEVEFCSTEIQTIFAGESLSAVELSRKLEKNVLTREKIGQWPGIFPRQWRILNALREDTQDMMQTIIKEEKIEAITFCFYNRRLSPFLAGEKSLDSNKFNTLVNLAPAINRLPFESPSRQFLSQLQAPPYLLVLLTEKRIILFLRGPLSSSEGRWREVTYPQVTKVELNKVGTSRSILLHTEDDLLELPELKAEEARRLSSLIERLSIENIKSQEYYIEIDFLEERRKLEMLKQGGVITEQDYRYRLGRLEKMDAEKFSKANVERILTLRYEDEAIAAHLDGQLLNKFQKEQTIMFTDIVGYSSRSANAEMMDVLSMLAVHDSLLLPLVRRFRGTLIKKIGDALMVRFDDPVDAVECGKEMQQALARFNKKHNDQLTIRIGLNSGQVFIRDDDVYGDVVNVACRMEQHCEPGKILLARATYDSVRGTVPCKSAGTRVLKDGRELEVFKVQ